MRFLPIIFFLFVMLLNPFQNSLALDYAGTYYIYTTEHFVNNACSTISSGNGYIISCSSEDYTDLYNNLNKNKIAGISFETTNADVDTLIKKLQVKVIQNQQLDDIVFLYGYSPMLHKFVNVDGEIINIQIAKRGEIIKIGYPLILDSA